VQTGQTIGHFHLTLLPPSLSWIGTVLGQSLGIKSLEIDYGLWLDALGIQVADDVDLTQLDGRWISLFSLMGDYRYKKEPAETPKPKTDDEGEESRKD
jgi:hypothetical protein